jgi:hypothetical protein
MIAALLLLQAAGGIPGIGPGFGGAQPTAEERLALPHVADAMRATTPDARRKSFDAAMALLPQPTRFRGAVQCLRGPMLMSADAAANRAAGLQAIDECYRLNPDVPLAQRVKADALFFTNDWAGGATLLASAIRREPRLARGLNDSRLDTLFRRLGYARAFAERRALVAALAGTDVARNDAARYSGWVRESVLERIGTGDLAEAARLLPYVVDPADGLQMLVDRRYEPLWPRIDEWAGGTLEVQREALVRAARASYDIEPTLARARSVAGVLARTGHAGEGAALLGRAITAFGAPRDDYDYAVGVVRLARLTAEAGERDADRILAPLRAALANGVAGPMLVNVVPNLAMFQVALGRPADALATLERHPIASGKVETRAAYGYFVAIRGCALAKLRRTAEARAALAEVERSYRANPASVDLATACIGSDEQLLAQWLKRADDPETRTGALIAMTRARAGVSDDPLSPSGERLRAVAGRAQVSERLARYARELPAGYGPALNGWRAVK